MTGRTHQIRVHLAHISHPVVGDPLYNSKARIPARLSEDLKNCLHLFHRQALHAATLTLMHPQSKEQLTFHAPLPDDFSTLLTLLDEEYEY